MGTAWERHGMWNPPSLGHFSAPFDMTPVELLWAVIGIEQAKKLI
jgi:hypothetical protein